MNDVSAKTPDTGQTWNAVIHVPTVAFQVEPGGVQSACTMDVRALRETS